MHFILQHFDDISLKEWYVISQLRVSVFVVEQHCPYQEFDGKDLYCHHLSGFLQDQLVAYARIVPPGISYDGYASIGRVVSNPIFRKHQYGKGILKEAIKECAKLYPEIDIKISAQSYLLKFYESFGFRTVGDIYLEDNIPHQAMILKWDVIKL
jgi:ElaA protein